jgi:hypothetical protein
MMLLYHHHLLLARPVMQSSVQCSAVQCNISSDVLISMCAVLHGRADTALCDAHNT